MKKTFLSLIGVGALAGAVLFIIRQNPTLMNTLSEDSCCSELAGAAAIEWDFQKEPEPAPKPGTVRVPIFIYHSVRPQYANEPKDQDAYDVTPELFEQELRYLKDNNYSVLSLDALANHISSGTKPPAKSVILTFDDGWRNQYKYAFPLLKKYGFTATFYVYTKALGKKHFMTWDDVLALDKAGMTVASHTLSHPYFRTLSLSEVRREAAESKKILGEKLGKPVLHFASPFGYSSPDIVTILKDAGYVTARTTYKGAFHGADNLLTLRGFLTDDSLEHFIKIAEGKSVMIQ